MVKRDKRLAQMRRNPRNVRPDELDAALKAGGFRVRNQSGSHKNYVRDSDGAYLTIPQHKPFLKAPYVLDALDALGVDEEEE